MKFKFCGEGDCPLWALAALHALGSLPAQLFRALLDSVLDDKPDDEIMEILKNTNLASRDEAARAAAVIRWVLHSAWSHSCPGQQLAKDLAVLAVPRTHATALAMAADERRQTYEDGVRSAGFTVNKLTDVSITPAANLEGTYKITLHSENAAERNRTELYIEKSQAKNMLEELRRAKKRMDEIETQELFK